MSGKLWGLLALVTLPAAESIAVGIRGNRRGHVVMGQQELRMVWGRRAWLRTAVASFTAAPTLARGAETEDGPAPLFRRTRARIQTMQPLPQSGTLELRLAFSGERLHLTEGADSRWQLLASDSTGARRLLKTGSLAATSVVQVPYAVTGEDVTLELESRAFYCDDDTGSCRVDNLLVTAPTASKMAAPQNPTAIIQRLPP